MSASRTLVRAHVFAVAVVVALAAAPAAAKRPARGKKLAVASKAVSKKMIDALAIELERSMNMRVPGAPPPYFVSYKLTEVEVNDAVATLGAKTASKKRHFVSIEAHVHVGNYQLDNTNFVMSQRETVDGIATAQLPLEATPAIARKLAWLATDQAYKEALQQYTAKRETIRNGAASTNAPSYLKVSPQVVEKPVPVVALESEDELIARTRRLSKGFRKHKHVRESRIAQTSFLERRWYLNSEGTSSHDTRRVSGLLVTASAQAKDGQELNLYFTRYGHSGADLPSDAAVRKKIDQLASNLKALISAPLVDSYTGPVLFQREGAVGMARYTLTPHLTGTPPPVGVSAQELAVFGGELVKRLGRRVTSNKLSIKDDPTSRFIGKTAVIGGYLFDDEGVRAKEITIVDKGMLKTLPTSRTPSKELPVTNGHARRSVAGGLFRGSPTNLAVASRGGKSPAALKAQLLRMVKKEGLPYGLIIRQFEDVAITANADLSRIELVQLLRSVDPNAPPIATLAYKVLPNGKEELVRGVQLKRTEVNEWRSIAAVGRKQYVKNFLATTENPLFMRIQGGAEGFVPSAGVESAVATPDLLFPELTVERSQFGTRPPPLVPAP
ncbi:MAG: hypothetical protein KJO07_07250 [Deltaproteobacteria bacterium]|nr:hypothetical protein [Deltaproteobacteria bacterium]